MKDEEEEQYLQEKELFERMLKSKDKEPSK
jgi:hypothetical protein